MMLIFPKKTQVISLVITMVLQALHLRLLMAVLHGTHCHSDLSALLVTAFSLIRIRPMSPLIAYISHLMAEITGKGFLTGQERFISIKKQASSLALQICTEQVMQVKAGARY